jgi:gliding motility-associated-like protein
MKNTALYRPTIALFFALLFFACETREENQEQIVDDANFQAQTQEFLIGDNSDYEINSCYYENNDLRLVFNGQDIDSLRWLKRNALNEFIRISSLPYINIAQEGAFRLISYKHQQQPVVRNISVYTCAAGIETVPNAFTPNGDNQFDKWAPIGKGVKSIKFTITSINNEKVFESESLDHPWDGTYNGKPVPTGSYRYNVQGTLYTGKAFIYKGILSLSR